MLRKPTLVGLALLLAGNVALGALWRQAAVSAQEAAQEAAVLRSNLAAAVEAERRSWAAAERMETVLEQWQAERERIDTHLADTRRTLTQLRAAAREETHDASLACAVLPVPAGVDRLLHGAN